jgi:benzoyl-CoA 2,3-dioxygenase component A
MPETMNLPAGFVRQHLIDPEMCARCNGCEESCTRHAITHDYRNYVVDVERCDYRMDCIKACSTGAIDNWRIVPAAAAYPLEEQLAWQELPPPRPLEGSVEADAVAAALVQAGRRAHAPASAARPSVNLFTPAAPGVATIIENRALTAPADGAEVRHIVLAFDGTPCPVLEGQSIGVIPPGSDSEGRPHHVRLYSVANARDGERAGSGAVAFTVKRVRQDHAGRPARGVCSNYLCDLPAGSRIQVTGPVGDTFLMPDKPGRPLLMICTGTGIAPMRGMIQRRLRVPRESGGPLYLFYGGRTPAELPYRDELQRLPDGFLDVHLALSREPGQPRTYVQDLLRRQSELITQLVLHERCYVYLCGLTGMEHGVHEALSDILREAGADWDQLLPQFLTQGRYHVEVY